MKPEVGTAVEVGALALVLLSGLIIPSGAPLAVFFVVAQLVSTYLIHCPAHYLIGRAFGIRFTAIRRGRTGLVKVLPGSLAGLAKLISLPTLKTEKVSLVKATRTGVATMYASGTVASSASAIIIASFATRVEPLPFALYAWAVAVGYLLFDLVFSPRSGDLYRARNALRLLALKREPRSAYEPLIRTTRN